MAQATDEATWKVSLTGAGIPEAKAAEYAQTFVEQEIDKADVSGLSTDLLKSLGVSIIGHQLKIMKIGEVSTTNNAQPTDSNQQSLKLSLKAELPKISRTMTKQAWRLFMTDWTVSKNLHKIAPAMIPELLYSRCDKYVRNSLNVLKNDFRTMSEVNLLQTIEGLVTEKTNPWLHRIKFADLTQHAPGEDIQSFYLRLQQHIPDCEYVCPNDQCNQDLSDEHIKHHGYNV